MTENNATDRIDSWQLGNVTFSVANQQLQRDGKTINLEPRQHGLLLALLSNTPQPITRDQLIACVWQGRIVSESAINRAVSVLRKAFHQLDPNSDYIQTRPKLGYQLGVAATPSQTPTTPQKPGDPARHKLNRYGYLLATLITALTLLWWWQLPPQSALQVSQALPHTSFDGVESLLNSNNSTETLLYQRFTETGNSQIWMNQLADNRHVALTESADNSISAALSPDGSQFAYVRYQATECQIIVRSISPSESPPSIVHSCPVDNIPMLQWHQDGKRLYLRQRADKTRPYQLYQLSLASGRLQQLTLLPASYSGLGDIALAVSPYSAQLAAIRYVSTSRSQLIIINQQTGEQQQSTELDVRATNINWFNSQQLILSAGQTLYKFDLSTQTLQPLYHAADFISSVALTKHAIYFSSSEINTDIWHSSPDSAPQRIVNSTRIDSIPRVSHDGRTLAFLSTRSGHYQLWLKQFDGTEHMLAELPGSPSFVRFEWSSDNQNLLLTQDGAAFSVHVESGKLTELLPAKFGVNIANWGPDNSSIIFSSQRNGDWQLWQYDLQQHSLQQLTFAGGYAGRIWQNKLYFTKYHQDGLWFKDPAQTEEQLLIAGVDKINWLNWQIDQGTIYYYQPNQGIFAFDISSGEVQLSLAEPDNFVRHFSVLNQQIYYVQKSPRQGDIYRLPILSH